MKLGRMPNDLSDIRALLPQAAKLAKPPISNFHVGAVCRGTTTGKVYLGANVEFAGEALSFTVHAEQAAITNAWINGEAGIDLLAVTAAPCGYCRQFLNELSTAATMQISIGDEDTHPLSYFLPQSFGPSDLGVTGGLMTPADNKLAIAETDDLALAALRAANMSYAPYSKSFAGVALRTSGGRTFLGPYGENAAFNPSISPLEVALSALNVNGGDWSQIEGVVLVHTEPSLHASATRTVLAAISSAPLRTITARPA
jgi:cytidine deaminase